MRGVRIGVPRSLLEQGVDSDVSRALTAALDTLQARGATLVDVELPYAKYAIPVYYLVSTAEASSNLARYDGVRYGFRANPEPRMPNHDLRQMYAQTRARGFGPEVKRRIMLGTYVLSAGYYDAYYLKAQQVRTLILRDYEHAFQGSGAVDAIAMPTSPTPAFRIGERMSDPRRCISPTSHGEREPGRTAGDQHPCGFTQSLPRRSSARIRRAEAGCRSASS